MPNKDSTSGFTLIETIVSIAIFVLALGVLASFILYSYRTHAYTLEQSSAINEARKGIETMIQEIREARIGDDGAYILEKADDYEMIFYSDIDKDGATERVRYFIYEGDGLTGDCVSYAQGGSCQVNWPNFSSQEIESAQVEVCVEGDLDASNEYVDIFADGQFLGALCQTGCGQCAGLWQGCTKFNVTSQANDGSILFMADGSKQVGSGGGGFCNWGENNHSLKARFIFSWTETETGQNISLKKGVTNPSEHPIGYPLENEEISVLSQYVRNQLPIFRYFNGEGNELPPPARLEETKLIRTFLIINVNPEREPDNFELESNVQIRNLKTNL